MESPISYIQSEWAVISGAPFTIMAVAALIWAIVWWIHRERFRALKEVLEIREARIREFQEKTDSGTPDEAQKKLEALERQMSDVEYRATMPSPPS